MAKPLINIGDKIHCPTCKAVQLEVIHPIDPSNSKAHVSHENFRVPDNSNFNLHGDAFMVSYCCNSPFFVNGALYVNMEWLPHYPFNAEYDVANSSLQS